MQQWKSEESNDMSQESSNSDREDEDMETEGRVREDEATFQSFEDIRESIVVFVAKLKLNTSIPDSFIDSVIKDVADITNSLIDTFINNLLNFKEQAKDIGIIEQHFLQQMLQNLQKILMPFDGLMTEHQRKDYFTKHGAFVPPEEKLLGHTIVPSVDRGTGLALQEGLVLDCPCYQGKVYPMLFQFVGDNLALNPLLGFAGSFSANYYCRFCKSHKTVSQTAIDEDEPLLRTKENFEKDLQTSNLSETGVSHNSILNHLSNYHIIDNKAVDIMHDLFEGVIPKEIKLILGTLIAQGCFTLDDINNRIASFDYGFIDKKNRPSPILSSALNNPSGASGQKAAQMMTLFFNIPLMLGDKFGGEESKSSSRFSPGPVFLPGSDSEESTSAEPMSSSEESPPPTTASASVPALKRENCFSFDARAILRNHPLGRQVTKEIDERKVCTPANRRILVNACVAHLIELHGSKPNAVLKEALAQAIVNAFPCLRDPRGNGYEAFYSKGAHKRPACGWLEDHLRYIRKKSKNIASQVPSTPNQTANEDSKENSQELKGCDAQSSDNSLTEKVNWLKEHNSPEENVKQAMKETVFIREAFIKGDKKNNIRSILTEYPRLLDPGMAATKMQDRWDEMAENILLYANKMDCQWEKVLPGIPHQNLSADEKKNLAFYLLPVLFRFRSGKKEKCTLLDAVHAFIDFLPVVTSLAEYCKKISSEDRPQPFVVALGTERCAPKQTFVIIEKKPIPQSSLMVAIDFCFKSYYVLDIEYQLKCKGAWEFIQSEIYGLGIVRGSGISSSRAFVASK
ncbi:hypothetical protein HOLleu_07132 [Holothuria leucospilota]|uniref:Uncharacterized protein n=1 Tax=Holothuria leucospilota TaxID=206669 RepID=A0A9Q1CFH6_HOLLE|nr:hypothetical protein HOLleu_07132 [Holothuria leucospilota]